MTGGGELGELYERFYNVYSSTSPRYVSPGKARERSKSQYQPQQQNPPSSGNASYDYELRFQEMQQRHASHAAQAMRMRPPPGRQPRQQQPYPQEHPQHHRNRSPFHGYQDQQPKNEMRHFPQRTPHTSYNRSQTVAARSPSPAMRPNRGYNNPQEPADWIPRNQPTGMQVRPDWAQSRTKPPASRRAEDVRNPSPFGRRPSPRPEHRYDEIPRQQQSSDWSRNASPYGRTQNSYDIRNPPLDQQRHDSPRNRPLSRENLFSNDFHRQQQPPSHPQWFPKTAELPEIVSYPDGAVDITTLIKQRQHLDELIANFEKRGRSEKDFEGESREAQWRRSREAQIERLRRENSEREELIDMERRRLDELRERAYQQRVNTTNKELEYKRQRLAVEERHSAMRKDYKSEKRRQLERETDYYSMNLQVDSSLEGRRRDAEYDAMDIQMQAGSARKQAALLLEDELLIRDVEAQQLDRMHEQQQRDVLAWQRDGHRDQRNQSESSTRKEMLMAMQEKHYNALVHLGTRPERQRIAASELDSRVDIAVAETFASESLGVEAITIITTQEADSRATINLQQSSESSAIYSFLVETIQILSSESSDVKNFWKLFAYERSVAEEATRASQDAKILQLEVANAAAEEQRRKLEEQSKLEEEQKKLEEEKAAEERRNLELQKQEEEKATAERELQKQEEERAAAEAAAAEQQKKDQTDQKVEPEKEVEKVINKEDDKGDSKSKTPAKPAPPPAPPSKPTEKPADSPASKPVVKPADPPAPPTTKPAEKPAVKPAEKPSKPAAKSTSKANSDSGARRHTFRTIDDWTEFYDEDKERMYYRDKSGHLTQNIYETKFFDKTKELEKLVKLGSYEKKADTIIDTSTKKVVTNVDEAVQNFATDVVKEMARQLQAKRWLIGETAGNEVTITECVDGKKVKNGKKWAKNFYSMVREELTKSKKTSSSSPKASAKPKPAAKSKISDSDFEAIAEKMIAAKKWKLWEKKNGTKCYRDMAMESKEWIKAAEMKKLVEKGEVTVK